MSIVASGLYFIAWICMMSGFFFFRRKEETSQAAAWIGVTIYMSMMYNAFMGGILCLINIPLNLYTFAILDGITGVLLWILNKRRGTLQKYRFNGYDIAMLVILVLCTYRFMDIRYDGLILEWNYKAVDPSAHLREALEYYNDQAISRMFFAQLNNGMFIQFFAPFVKYDYLYRAYVLADVANLLLSGVVFYGVVKRFCKNHVIHIAAMIATLFFMLGYPLNSTIWGFTYLQMGVNIAAVSIVLVDVYVKDEAPRWYSLLTLMIAMHGIFQCYALYMPLTYLAVGFALLYKQYQKKQLISKRTFADGFAIFLLPVILGLVYTYRDVFLADNVEVGEALSAEGGMYRDLFSNFMWGIPVVILAYCILVKKKENGLLMWFVPFHIIMATAMLYLGVTSRAVSTYYFYKNYYLFWLEFLVLIVYGISQFEKQTVKLCFAYFGMWGFTALLLVQGWEMKLQANNELYVPDVKSTHINDLLMFNQNTTYEAKYPLDKLNLEHYVYQNLRTEDGYEKPVAVVSNMEDTYLFECVTGQRLEGYEFWRDYIGHEAWLDKVENECGYAVVFLDSDLYAEYQEYFDFLDRLYETEQGFVAAIQ